MGGGRKFEGVKTIQKSVINRSGAFLVNGGWFLEGKNRYEIRDLRFETRIVYAVRLSVHRTGVIRVLVLILKRGAANAASLLSQARGKKSEMGWDAFLMLFPSLSLAFP
jgi:hypothetical protein